MISARIVSSWAELEISISKPAETQKLQGTTSFSSLLSMDSLHSAKHFVRKVEQKIIKIELLWLMSSLSPFVDTSNYLPIYRKWHLENEWILYKKYGIDLLHKSHKLFIGTPVVLPLLQSEG